MEKIIAFITQDKTIESVRREVDMLTDIHKYVSGDDETPAKFASRLKGEVVRYSIKCGDVDRKMDRKLTVLVLRSSKLTSDTRNGLTLKLYDMDRE